jgi:hypothetical protein
MAAPTATHRVEARADAVYLPVRRCLEVRSRTNCPKQFTHRRLMLAATMEQQRYFT